MVPGLDQEIPQPTNADAEPSRVLGALGGALDDACDGLAIERGKPFLRPEFRDPSRER